MRAVKSLHLPSFEGLARDCLQLHLRGFPEFDTFYFSGFPESTHIMFKALALTTELLEDLSFPFINFFKFKIFSSS